MNNQNQPKMDNFTVIGLIIAMCIIVVGFVGEVIHINQSNVTKPQEAFSMEALCAKNKGTIVTIGLEQKCLLEQEKNK